MGSNITFISSEKCYHTTKQTNIIKKKIKGNDQAKSTEFSKIWARMREAAINLSILK